jgi:hypothetical protein
MVIVETRTIVATSLTVSSSAWPLLTAPAFLLVTLTGLSATDRGCPSVLCI